MCLLHRHREKLSMSLILFGTLFSLTCILFFSRSLATPVAQCFNQHDSGLVTMTALNKEQRCSDTSDAFDTLVVFQSFEPPKCFGTVSRFSKELHTPTI